MALSGGFVESEWMLASIDAVVFNLAKTVLVGLTDIVHETLPVSMKSHSRWLQRVGTEL
jgi:hypothetical protein